MNIYQSNTYRKDLSWLHFDDEPMVQDRQQVKDISVFVQSTLRKKKTAFRGGSFSNRDNVRALIQFRRESQLQHLNR